MLPRLLLLLALSCYLHAVAGDGCTAAVGGATYDFTALANAGDMTTVGADGKTYVFRMCGSTSLTCATGTVTNGMAVQQVDQDCWVLGVFDGSEQWSALGSGPSDGVKMTLANGEIPPCPAPRSMEVDFTCDPTTDVPDTFSADEDPPCNYKIQIASKAGCSTSGGGGGPFGPGGVGGRAIWATATLIIVPVALVVYCAAGVTWNVKRNGTGLTKEAIPNRAFWADLPHLVKEGNVYFFGVVKMTIARIRRGGGGAASEAAPLMTGEAASAASTTATTGA